jgi:beta-lactamase superfamily II metal-dependent hydrolase
MAKKKPTATQKTAPIVAPGSPNKYRARVRMYRHGLGDCFLVTFPRKGKKPFQMLIDCGALARDGQFMTQIVEHIRDTVRDGKTGKARLDVVVATHEHKDHLSGFNQARKVFNDDFDFGAVWLGWTENLTKPEIKKIKEAKKKAVAKLRAALDSPLAAAAGDTLDGVAALLGFSEDEDSTGTGKIAEALDYLKLRGKDAGELQYYEPGTGPLKLDGVEDVRVFVLGPPRDPILLKGSEVTEKLKEEGVVYHLAATGEAGMDALSAALSGAAAAPGADGERYHPFAAEHRITPQVPDPQNPGAVKPHPYFGFIAPFVQKTYDDPAQAWRRVDHDWLNAFNQLALDLDNDTNNTSLVLAFEFVKTREVLLFVGDAQVGNWQSWAKVEFKVPGGDQPLPAHELLSRTVFYKVGHHCSHNATLKKGGLELMTRDDLVAFIPLDKETAAKQGKKDPATGKPKGWEMPAPSLYKALLEKATKRVVLSDVKEAVSAEAKKAGVIATGTYIDYFLK